MALRISFERGAVQSLNAGRYFSELADELVTDLIGSMTSRQFVIMNAERPPLLLRMWSTGRGLDDEGKEDLLNSLLSVTDDVEALEAGPVGHEDLNAIVERWTAPLHGMPDLLLEQLHRGQNFACEQPPRLSIVVLGGHMTMLSTDRVMFIRMEDHLHGLTIAGHGSYLAETLHGNAVPQRQHQARA